MRPAALDLFRALGSANTDCRQDGSALGQGPREGWLFNSGLQGIENADAVLIVGANPRAEAPLLNARLRKAWLAGKTVVGLIGEQVALTFDYNYLGAGSKTVGKLPKPAMDFLSKAERPAIIVGAGALTGETGEHGVGVEKRDLEPVMFSEADLAQQQRVKCAFDPDHRLNPGKVFPVLHRCAELGRMHVSRGQVPFPDLPRF